MSEQMRLDAALVSRGLIGGRDRAKELISNGFVLVNGSVVKKAAYLCAIDDRIELLQVPEFVSRGGEKLEKALSVFPVNVQDVCALDIGASTGGFTQCLLNHGAKEVYAVDVGHGQLAEVLRMDSRVHNLEGTNIRDLHPELLREKPALAVCDASFISIRLIFPVLRNVLAPGANCIFLVKPQFEAGRQNVGKKGVVKDPAVHKMVLRQVLDAVSENGFTPIDLTHSPIRGPEGNIEFLLWFSDVGESKMFNVDEIVRAAHREHAAG